jgi:hypothetical protein
MIAGAGTSMPFWNSIAIGWRTTSLMLTFVDWAGTPLR